MIKHWARLVRNGIYYLIRGDFRSFFYRLRIILAARKQVITNSMAYWGVLTAPHTLFVAHLVAERLREHGWVVDILTEPLVKFPHQMYVVICAQIFTKLPPDGKRIIFQMEQSISSRWFSKYYLNILENSIAVLDYALVNLEFLADKGIRYPHVYYLPIGASKTYMAEAKPEGAVYKTYDLLFYGDAKSSPRRRKLLDVLRQHFSVHICNEIFGVEMAQEIRKARAVINLHYYEGALLETTRIQECLSLGVPVISESSRDQNEYPWLKDVVIYFNEGDEEGMISAARATLERIGDNTLSCSDINRSVEASEKYFKFMFDRFLISRNILSFDKLQVDLLPIPEQTDKIVLSMPETIERRRVYEVNRLNNCAVFDGIRRSPGWIGCGLSYSYIARHALYHGIKRLMVMEDDVLLPIDFEEKLHIVHAYLDAKSDEWDIFVGVIASLHKNVKILAVEVFEGMQFVTINCMTSMVCNIYNERSLQMLSKWDADDQNAQTNTIDRFLERQASLRVVVVLPFLVGHREDVNSTLWGFANGQYSIMISGSERKLMIKTDEFLMLRRDNVGG